MTSYCSFLNVGYHRFIPFEAHIVFECPLKWHMYHFIKQNYSKDDSGIHSILFLSNGREYTPQNNEHEICWTQSETRNVATGIMCFRTTTLIPMTLFKANRPEFPDQLRNSNCQNTAKTHARNVLSHT